MASNLDGRFALSSAILELSGLTFEVPGAVVELQGSYGLKNEEIDLSGTLHMDARLSETTTGFKSSY